MKSLSTAVTERLSSLQLGPLGVVLSDELGQMLNVLLETITCVSNPRQKIALADAIFQHLVVKEYPGTPRNPKLRSQIWRALLESVWHWEDEHEVVHKGTPYFFMAQTYLESGDVPSAYTCMFSALEEDKRNRPVLSLNVNDGPAYRTISLVNNTDNALHSSVVLPLRSYLQKFITEYNARTGETFALSELDRKFLQASPMESIKGAFVANLHEIYYSSSLASTRLIKNDYSKLEVIDTMFNLGLVADQLLQHRFQVSSNRMAEGVYQLGLHHGWINKATCKNAGEFISKVNPNPNDGSPDAVLPSFLDRTATFDGVQVDFKQRATLGTYHLRNYGGHHIEVNEILVDRYDDVLSLILDAVLVCVEVL
jgi:hypothetical protein